MNKEEFVEVIKLRVVEGSIKGLKQILLDPPGRSPHKDLVEESIWFNSLNEGSRNMVERIIRRSVELGTFSFLGILDGVNAIENGAEKGTLRLIYEKDGQEVLLNDDESDYLHDLM